MIKLIVHYYSNPNEYKLDRDIRAIETKTTHFNTDNISIVYQESKHFINKDTAKIVIQFE